MSINFRRGISRLLIAISAIWFVGITAAMWERMFSPKVASVGDVANAIPMAWPAEGFTIQGDVIGTEGSRVTGKSLDRNRDKLWTVKIPYRGDFTATGDDQLKAIINVYVRLQDERKAESRQLWAWITFIPIAFLAGLYFIGLWIAKGFRNA